MEYKILKLVALVSLFTVVLPLLRVYIQVKMRQKVKERPKGSEDSFHELKILKSIYEKERKPYYLEARAVFNSLCKQGKMHHEDVVLLRKLIEDCLGEYRYQYDRMKFQNEYNRIYVYMKNWHITKFDWQKIISFLNELQGESEATV